MPRTHERDSFYKYMTVGTAKAVLTNTSLRYSSPLLFNDPFDHQIDFNFDFTEEGYVEKYLETLAHAVFGSEEINFAINTRQGELHAQMRKYRNNLNKGEILNELRPAVVETAKKWVITKMKLITN